MRTSVSSDGGPIRVDQSLQDRLCQIDAALGATIAHFSRFNLPQLEFQLAGRVTIVVPVFNERATIGPILARLAALPIEKQIIVVDDGSSDGTRQWLTQLHGVDGMELVFQSRNLGKGAALREGFARARGEFVVIQDADLEYDPRDILRLLVPLARGDADVVFGSRFVSGSGPRRQSTVHRWGNWLLTAASNAFSRVRLTDMETGYKAFRATALRDLKLEQNRFGIEPELTAKLLRRGFRIAEIPISYRARGYPQGKKIGLRDFWQALYCIVRYGIRD